LEVWGRRRPRGEEEIGKKPAATGKKRGLPRERGVFVFKFRRKKVET
jgi:hypothetical protein